MPLETVAFRPRWFILTAYEGYYFNPETDCTIDVEEFARYCEKARYLEQHGRYAEASKNYEAAVQLYQGEFLSEDRYEDWAILERQYRREEFLLALSHLAECYARLGQYKRAIVCCRRALCTEGYREDLYRQLMLYQWLLGNPAEALRVYKQCCERMSNSLAREPSVVTQRLCEQIRRRENLDGASERRELVIQGQAVPYPAARF